MILPIRNRIRVGERVPQTDPELPAEFLEVAEEKNTGAAAFSRNARGRIRGLPQL
jgi:hypothetical protein